MFDKIVVPLDGTEPTEVAIHPALALATQGGASLVLVSVTPPDLSEERRDYLHGRKRGTFLPCEIEVITEGTVVQGVLRTVARHEPALLCMASHGRGRFGLAMFGATSANVVRALEAPVLIAGPRCANVLRYSEVVVAVSSSDESAAVLPAAVALAAQIDAKLQIVEVIGLRDLREAEAAASGDVRESGRVARLAAALAADGVAAGWEVLHDHDPAHGLLTYLEAYPNALLAMTTGAREGLSLLAESSVANHVVHRSANPVLLVHS